MPLGSVLGVFDGESELCEPVAYAVGCGPVFACLGFAAQVEQQVHGAPEWCVVGVGGLCRLVAQPEDV